MRVLWSALRMLGIAALVFGLWYSLFGWNLPEGLTITPAQFYFRICVMYAVFLEAIWQASMWLSYFSTKEERERVASRKVIGDWRSDVVEIRETGRVHFKIQTLQGLCLRLDSMHQWSAKGIVKIDYWEPGMHLKQSAEIPLELLYELKESC